MNPKNTNSYRSWDYAQAKATTAKTYRGLNRVQRFTEKQDIPPLKRFINDWVNRKNVVRKADTRLLLDDTTRELAQKYGLGTTKVIKVKGQDELVEVFDVNFTSLISFIKEQSALYEKEHGQTYVQALIDSMNSSIKFPGNAGLGSDLVNGEGHIINKVIHLLNNDMVQRMTYDGTISSALFTYQLDIVKLFTEFNTGDIPINAFYFKDIVELKVGRFPQKIYKLLKKLILELVYTKDLQRVQMKY